MTTLRLDATSLAAATLLALAALPALAEEGNDQKIKVQAGEAFFASDCRRCHATDADKSSYGPLLEGVIGRRAGSMADYPYSEALGSAGFMWTEGALKAWMEDNQGLVPGTKMRHVGISDPVVQEFILAYLRSVQG
jgi:cytochrome c